MSWGRFVDALVVIFRQPIDAAWSMTPHDFWRLMAFRMELNRGKNVRVRPMTRAEMEALIEQDEARERAKAKKALNA